VACKRRCIDEDEVVEWFCNNTAVVDIGIAFHIPPRIANNNKN
jgi:hypothetical protein